MGFNTLVKTLGASLKPEEDTEIQKAVTKFEAKQLLEIPINEDGVTCITHIKRGKDERNNLSLTEQ